MTHVSRSTDTASHLTKRHKCRTNAHKTAPFTAIAMFASATLLALAGAGLAMLAPEAGGGALPWAAVVLAWALATDGAPAAFCWRPWRPS